MKKAFSLTALLALCGLGVGVLASCQEIPAIYLGGEVEEVHTHSYTSSVTTAATCIEDGVMTYTCSCGESYTEVIPALGHDFSITQYVTIGEGEEPVSGWHYVCSRCGEVGEALEEGVDPFSVGSVCASSEAGLKAALDAVGEDRQEEVTITITSDMTIGEGASSGSEFVISASNVTICGVEGVTITLNQEITVSGDNVTFTGLNLDGSSITNTSASASKEHVIYVTGSSFTITDCTISSSVTAGILVEGTSSYDITISNCDINAPRAVYAVAPSGSTGTITLTISGSHLEGTYPFNLTRYNGTITVTDSELVGWTSYSTVTNATFKGCTFSFSDRGDYAYGMLRAYGPTVLDHCYFASYDGSGVSSTNYVASGHGEAANANNFVISTGSNSAIYTVIDCQFEDVTIGEEGVGNTIEVKDITSETVVSLIETEAFSTTYTSSGFKFGSEDTLWTYSDLTSSSNGQVEG